MNDPVVDLRQRLAEPRIVACCHFASDVNALAVGKLHVATDLIFLRSHGWSLHRGTDWTLLLTGNLRTLTSFSTEASR